MILKLPNRRMLGVPFTGLASLLIGLIQILWSAAPMVSEWPGSQRSPFVQALEYTGIGDEWLLVMLLSGLLLSTTSISLLRSLRHVALITSGIVLLATFPILWEYGLRTPLSFTSPLMGAYCILLLAFDVHAKQQRLNKGRRDDSD